MILATTIESRVKSALDDDNNDNGRYSWEHGIRAAVNNGIDYVVAVFNATYGITKLSEESLRDLAIVESVPVDNSAFLLSALSHEVWSILSIYPFCFEYSIYPLCNRVLQWITIFSHADFYVLLF